MATATSRRRITGTIHINVLLSFVFGVLFIAVMLVFAVAFPNPSPFQIKVFITVLALAAGGVGAILPGFLELERKGLFRAGGALALAALVLLSQTPLTEQVVTYKTPAENPRPLADAFLLLNDSGQIAQAWSDLDPDVRELSFHSLADYQAIYMSFRVPLGAVRSRQFVGVGGAQSPPGLPVGLYQYVMYRTQFAADDGCRFETVVFRATQDVRWRVATYFVEPRPGPCSAPPPLKPPASL